jgi:hypothetical protein
MHLTNPPQPIGRGLLANAPVLSPLALNLAVATYLIALCNQTFWGHLLRIFDGWTPAALGFRWSGLGADTVGDLASGGFGGCRNRCWWRC